MLPLEEITVRVRAVAAGFGESDNERHTKFGFVTGSVVDHEQYTGETITWIGYFTDKTTARTLESYLHFGFAGEDLSVLEEADEAKCAELLPEVVEFVCAPEEYDGKWTLKVKWVNKVGRGKFAAKKKLEGAELKAFAAQMKNSLKSARGAVRNGAPKASGGSPHPNAPGSRDDVPF